MAIKQGLRMQLFVTLVAFVLTYATMRTEASKNKTHKDANEKKEVDQWFKSKNSDPKHPWYKQKLPPQPHTKFYQYAEICLDDVLDNKKCEKEIFDGLFERDEVDMKLCGCKIKEMGHMCMKAVAGTTGHMDKYKADAAQIYKRADKILDEADQQKCKEKKK